MGIVEQSRVCSTEPHLQSACYIGGSNAVEGGLVQIYFHVVLGLRVFDVPVHVDDAWSLLKNLLDLRGQFDLPLIVWPVNFGNQGLQNGWTRRNFGYLDARTEGRGNLVQLRPQSSCDLVTLRLAIVP